VSRLTAAALRPLAARATARSQPRTVLAGAPTVGCGPAVAAAVSSSGQCPDELDTVDAPRHARGQATAPG
jgi:hypothetical protein